MSYHPPIYSTGSIVSAAASSTIESELAKIKRGVESAEAAAERRQQDEEKMKRDTVVGSVVATCAISIGLLAMWMEASVICYLAFIFPMVTAPVIVHQRRKLNKFPSLQEENNMLRLSVNDLSLQNDQLETLNTKVEAQVSRLGDAENTLKTIAEEQGTDLTQLSALVSENGRLLRDMRALQESHIMGEVMTAIISSDHSRDFHIDKNEMAILLMRLRMCDGINHVDEEELRSRFRASKTNSIQTIVDITKSLMQEDQLQIVRNAETEQTQIV